MTLRRLHLWVPEWNGPGGIQAYSRHLVRACAALLPETRITVLIRNGPAPGKDESLGVRVQSTGAVAEGRRRIAYARLLVQTTLLERPDLIIITHLHFAPLAWALRLICPFRYWVVAHGIEAWSGLTRSRVRALRGADKILPVSHHTARRLEHLLGPKMPGMERLPNQVDENHFTLGRKPSHLLRRYGFSEKDPVLLTVARLDPRQRYKGCDQVLEALVRVRREIPSVRYVIAGRGADSGRLRRRAGELGLRESVVLTGFVPERDLCDHVRLCDLFVMPSRGEGFGIVFLEALACGRRVVAGDKDGAVDPLLDGKLGALVDPDDVPALADTLVRLLRAGCDAGHSQFLRSTVIEHFGTGAFRRRLQALLG